MSGRRARRPGTPRLGAKAHALAQAYDNATVAAGLLATYRCRHGHRWPITVYDRLFPTTLGFCTECGCPVNLVALVPGWSPQHRPLYGYNGSLFQVSMNAIPNHMLPMCCILDPPQAGQPRTRARGCPNGCLVFYTCPHIRNIVEWHFCGQCGAPFQWLEDLP